jgi:hypothetical protein
MRKIGLAVLWGLAVLLAGCEKEGVLGGSGEKVTVNFSLGDIDYKGGETVTRGDSEMTEIVKVPLGDGLFMYTTIEENLEAPTRAGDPLEDGVKVRVVAYQSSTVKGTGEYTVKSGMLVSENGSGFEVEEGTYTFVAYSYNSSTPPDYTEPTITVASPHDLLWGSHTQLVDASNSSVSITMDHLFAQVRVKATTTGVSGQPIIKSMTGVTVTPGNPVDLTIQTGGVGQNAVAATQAISEWNNLNSTVVTSGPITVNTNGANPIYVNISSVTIAEYLAFTGIKAEFKKALTAGYSYTLVVNFKKTIWAKSNIYWVSTGGSNGYLTFDTQENGHQGYQGVFFKWGSLVGISPAQAGGSDEYLDKTVPIYVPIFNVTTPTSSSWKATNGSAMAGDMDFPTVTNNWTDWAVTSALGEADPETSIPYMDGSYAKSGETTYYDRYSNTNNTYVIDEALNRDTTYQGFRGDICQYLSTKTGVVSGHYRLPSAEELGETTGSFWSDLADWIKGSGSFLVNNAAGNAAGSANLLDAAGNNGYTVYGSAIHRTIGDVVFPASGLRQNRGELWNVGGYGYYWAGSAYNVDMGVDMAFDTTVEATLGNYRYHALSVRCIRN